MLKRLPTITEYIDSAPEDVRARLQEMLVCLRKAAPGGSVWITDLITHEHQKVRELMWQRYGTYLESLIDTEFRDAVFAYIDKEDSPRPVTYQLDLLRRAGFSKVDILHKNSCFAAFGAVKTA